MDNILLYNRIQKERTSNFFIIAEKKKISQRKENILDFSTQFTLHTYGLRFLAKILISKLTTGRVDVCSHLTAKRNLDMMRP